MEDLSILNPENDDKKYGESLFLHSSKLFLICGIVMELLLAANLTWSCVSTFDCSKFLPTVSYLACYRGHDRLFNFTMVYWGMVLMLFNCAAYLNFRTDIKKYNSFLFLLGAGICIAQPCIAVFDEANTSFYVKTEFIHGGMMIGLILSSLFWIYLTYNTGKIKSLLNRYIAVSLSFLLWSISEWFYADKDGVFFSYFFEALSEWIAITFAIFLPFMYSRDFPDIKVTTAYYKHF